MFVNSLKIFYFLVCKGENGWQTAIFQGYAALKEKFDRNCTHILGNLLISGIEKGMI